MPNASGDRGLRPIQLRPRDGACIRQSKRHRPLRIRRAAITGPIVLDELGDRTPRPDGRRRRIQSDRGGTLGDDSRIVTMNDAYTQAGNEAQCSKCGAFIDQSSVECPVCGFAPRRLLRWAVYAGSISGGSIVLWGPSGWGLLGQLLILVSLFLLPATYFAKPTHGGRHG